MSSSSWSGRPLIVVRLVPGARCAVKISTYTTRVIDLRHHLLSLAGLFVVLAYASLAAAAGGAPAR
jgi:hypothetical protein